MSEDKRRYTTEEVLDLLDRDYDIPENGIDSDVEGLESDEEDEDIPQHIATIDEIPPDIEEIDFRNIIVDENDVEENIRGERAAAGRPPNFYFGSLDWTDNPIDTPAIPEFIEGIGPSIALPRDMSALDLFLLFVDDRMLSCIVRETNKYASQSLVAKGKDPNTWQELTLQELKAYLGLVIGMGMHSLPSLRDYWRDDWILGVPEFAKVMPRNRFMDINRFMHLNDNTKMPAPGSPEADKLFKVRTFIDSLRTNFLRFYNPNREQAVDEAMIKYKGRTSLKQYMPMKPIKRGIKMWCRADSHSGYLCDFEIYTGKHRDGVEHGLGYSVVSRLCQPIKGKWYAVFFDNFFTSYKLLEDLYCDKILGCGTVRQGRKGFPPILYDKALLKSMNRGDVLWRMKGPILALTWIDKKPVVMSGTVTGPLPDQLPTTQRRKKDGTLEDVPCPPIVSTYNCYMGGVDKNDQMKSYYKINVSGRKWWTRVFFDLIDRAIYNSFILQQESPNHDNCLMKDFRVDLAKLLIGNFTSRKKRGRSSLGHTQSKYFERHFPEYLPLNPNGRRMERRCTVCSDSHIKKKTSYYCPDCDVGLCPAPCFRVYHTS